MIHKCGSFFWGWFIDFQPLVQIGPPNAEFLKSKDKSTWIAKDVADSVLYDKSALVFCHPFSSLLTLIPLYLTFIVLQGNFWSLCYYLPRTNNVTYHQHLGQILKA